MISIKAYILHSPLETDRIHKVDAIKKQFVQIEVVPSIYPSQTRIPFLKDLIQISKERTAVALRASEVACLLGHRKIWHQIIALDIKDTEHVLVMESDSIILYPAMLEKSYAKYAEHYDLFFWGAWEGNLKIKRSSIVFKEDGFKVGTPLINTAYCMYGYSLNKKAAKYLLKQTKQISYPVDFFKKFVQVGAIRIGAIKEEVIGTWLEGSYIRNINFLYSVKRGLLLLVLNLRNSLKAYFS